METALFEIKFNDGRTFRIFCANSTQIKRFKDVLNKLEGVISLEELLKGIHTLAEFETVIK